MNKNPLTILIALVFTTTTLILGYVMLGLLPMFIFAFGFLGGFILWMTIPTNVSFQTIKFPLYLTFLFFILHKHIFFIKNFIFFLFFKIDLFLFLKILKNIFHEKVLIKFCYHLKRVLPFYAKFHIPELQNFSSLNQVHQ